MGFIIIILIIVIVVFISIKIANLKDRAIQHVLKDTDFSRSNINKEINRGFEKKQLEKFLQEHTEYTEESLRELFRNYCTQLFNRTAINEFSSSVCDKMQKDSKIDKMINMQYIRTDILLGANNQKINSINIYSDGKDEYNVYLYCSLLQDRIIVDRYLISKGAVVGF